MLENLYYLIDIYIYYVYDTILYSITIICAQQLQTANAITSLIRMGTVCVGRKPTTLEVLMYAMQIVHHHVVIFKKALQIQNTSFQQKLAKVMKSYSSLMAPKILITFYQYYNEIHDLIQVVQQSQQTTPPEYQQHFAFLKTTANARVHVYLF